MKKYLLLLVLPLLISCGVENEKEVNPLADSLEAVNSGLQGTVIKQDSSIQSFIKSFNDIQDNLDEIKSKEKVIAVTTANGEVKSKEGQILEDIQAIYYLMAKNKQRLASMGSKLKKSKGENEELQRMITRLTMQLEDKDVQINNLKTELDKLNIELSDLNTNYTTVVEESTKKTDELNTAFYAFGTSKELVRQGVLTKEGGFIGIGKAAKLKDDFNKSYFTKVDITKVLSISILAKKAKLITSHPASSYRFVGEGKVDKLEIIDSKEFWSVSKYLVIVVE